MPRIDSLFVLWSEPSAGRRSVIGRLWRDQGEYFFQYDADGVREAEAEGFKLLPEFPLVQPFPYRSRYLFSTFAQRIPSPKRPDYAAMLAAWGVSGDDQLELLAISGGIQETDSVELSEYRAATDQLMEPLRFRMASERFFPAAAELHPGDVLDLRRDPQNPMDPCATWLVLRSGVPVGYVPRPYSSLVAHHLEVGAQLCAKVLRRLPVSVDRGRWLISLSSCAV